MKHILITIIITGLAAFIPSAFAHGGGGKNIEARTGPGAMHGKGKAAHKGKGKGGPGRGGKGIKGAMPPAN